MGLQSWTQLSDFYFHIYYMWASRGALGVKNLPANAGDLGSIPGLGRSPGEEKGYPLQYSGLENSMDCMVHGVPKGGFPHSSVGKESACNEGDLSSIPGLGRSPGEEKGYPFQYSSLENFLDCIVHRVAKTWARLKDFHFTHFCPHGLQYYH